MLSSQQHETTNNHDRSKDLDPLYIVFDGSDSDSRDMLKQVLSLLGSKGYDDRLNAIDISEVSNEPVEIVKNGAAGVILLYGHSFPNRLTLLLVAARLNRVPVRLFYKGRLPIKFRFLNKLKGVYRFREKWVQDFLRRMNIQKSSAFTQDIKCIKRFVDVEHNNSLVRLAYYNFTDNKVGRPLLFFFHGVTANCITYRYLLQLLGEYFNVICIDLPGHGGSDDAVVKDLNELGDVVLKGVRQLYPVYSEKQNNQVIIMGHSLGGAMAFYVGSKLQKYIADSLRLALLNPAGLPLTEPSIKLLLKGILVRAQTLKMYIDKRDTVKSVLQDQLLFYVRKAIEGGFIKLGIRRYLDIIPKGLDLTGIDSVSVPTLLVFSDKEPFFGYEYRLRFLKLLRCAHYMEVSGGHDWPVLKPGNIKEIIGVLIEQW